MKRITLRMQALGMAALLLAALLAACASAPSAAEPKDWNPAFLSRLRPSEDLIQKLGASVQDVNAVSDCDGVILSVPQTLGDDHTLYLRLDITFPETINLRDYLTEDENGNVSGIVSIDEVSYYRGETSYEEIKDMDSIALKNFFLARGSSSPANSSSQTLSADLEQNSCSYLMQFTTDYGELTGDHISLVLENLGLNLREEDAIILFEGPLVISWQMENSGPTKEFTILDQNGEPAGNGWISSFCLDLDIKSDGFPSHDALIQAVQLIQTDGTAIPASGYNSVSFGSTASARWKFRRLIDLEQIKSIQIGDQYSASLVE